MNDMISSVHRNHIDNLARRAEGLIDRRRMFRSASRKLAVPALVTYACSRSAMGQTGSWGPSASSAPSPAP